MKFDLVRTIQISTFTDYFGLDMHIVINHRALAKQGDNALRIVCCPCQLVNFLSELSV